VPSVSRIDLRRDSTRLKTVHRRRVERQGDAPQMPDFDPATLDPETRRRAVQGFSQLFETEYESVVIAGFMTSALARIGAPLDLIGAFGKVVEDEIRHSDLVAQLLEGFGDRPSIPAQPLPPKPETISGPAAIEEVLAGMSSFFCVGEELSSHIFKGALEVAAEPRMRHVTSEIFSDEATHGAFGFEAAKELVRLIDDAARARVAARVVQAVRAFEQRLGGPLNEPEPLTDVDRALARLGLLPKPALLGIFYERMQSHVLPRLEDAGLPIDLRVRS
jgi:hypothetical protein